MGLEGLPEVGGEVIEDEMEGVWVMYVYPDDDKDEFLYVLLATLPDQIEEDREEA